MYPVLVCVRGCVRHDPSQVFFDVGANRGIMSEMWHQTFATLHNDDWYTPRIYGEG